MIRHILALLGLVVTLGTVWYLYQVDVEVDSMGKVKEIFRKSDLLVELGKKSANAGVLDTSTAAPLVTADETSKESKSDEADDKLKALREKAGHVGGFAVSQLYKSKCASCHGYNGEGGIGPKIIGLKLDDVSTKLADFKSGAKKNYVMYGLLQNLKDEELETLSKEISEFATKAEALKQ